MKKALGSVIDYGVLEKGGAGMCSLFEMIAEEGREEGREQGIEQGIEQGDLLRLIRTTYKKMLKGKTSEEISDEVEEDISLVERIKEAILEERKTHGNGDFDAQRVLGNMMGPDWYG